MSYLSEKLGVKYEAAKSADSIADYYENSAREARAIRAAIADEAAKPNPDKKRCAQLWIALEQAEYVGD